MADFTLSRVDTHPEERNPLVALPIGSQRLLSAVSASAKLEVPPLACPPGGIPWIGYG